MARVTKLAGLLTLGLSACSGSGGSPAFGIADEIELDTEATVQVSIRTEVDGLETASDDLSLEAQGNAAPFVVGELPVSVAQVRRLDGVQADLLLSVRFASDACSLALEVGDRIVRKDGVSLLIVDTDQDSGNPNQVPVIVESGVFGPAKPFRGTWRGPFDTDEDPPACFVSFNQDASAQGPSDSVLPNTTATIRFSEPMDPDSLGAMEGWGMLRTDADSALYESVPGSSTLSGDGRSVTFRPTLELNHAFGSTESYVACLDGAQDQTGTPLADPFPKVEFQLLSNARNTQTGGIVLRFDSADEDEDGSPELRGNAFSNGPESILQPRAVQRFSREISQDQPVVSLMIPFNQGIITPLNPFGSRMQTAWRSADMGLSPNDEAFYDIDVEGLSWRPFGGQVLVDNFDQFEMRLSHGSKLPDETLEPFLLPKYPLSGLTAEFEANSLDEAEVVHTKEKGYSISPIDLFVSNAGNTLLPWPLNQDAGSKEYWTWRDTALEQTGGLFGGGYPVTNEKVVLGLDDDFYDAGDVPSVGLPLIADFLCFPDDGAFGLNGLSIALAVNSSARPFFRAYSGGGINFAGQSVTVDPDQETQAGGGFNPNGNQTTPADNSLFYGQADFVVRISRAHSIWIPTQAGANVLFSAPDLVADMPAGTEILVEWRGAFEVFSVPAEATSNADNYDAYGNNDLTPAGCDCIIAPVFIDSGQAWTQDVNQLAGASFVQTRVTFIANAETGEIPTLKTLGLAYQE